MRIIYKITILIITISILVSPVFAMDNQSSNSATYRILIDQHYGFFRVFEMNGKLFGKELDNENRTLNISRNDTVIFVSDTIPDKRLTIVSNEELWKDKVLKYSGKEFDYTFNKSGIYDMFIKEYPPLKQKIIVGPIDINISNTINDTKPNLTNIINNTNMTIESGSTNTMSVKQDSTLNNTNSTAVISIGLTDGLRSKIRSDSDVLILSVILLGIYFLSGRIKEE